MSRGINRTSFGFPKCMLKAFRVEALDEVAEELAGDMYANDYFSSDSPHYGTLAERAKKQPLLDYMAQWPEVRVRNAWKPVPSPRSSSP